MRNYWVYHLDPVIPQISFSDKFGRFIGRFQYVLDPIKRFMGLSMGIKAPAFPKEVRVLCFGRFIRKNIKNQINMII